MLIAQKSVHKIIMQRVKHPLVQTKPSACTSVLWCVNTDTKGEKICFFFSLFLNRKEHSPHYQLKPKIGIRLFWMLKILSKAMIQVHPDIESVSPSPGAMLCELYCTPAHTSPFTVVAFWCRSREGSIISRSRDDQCLNGPPCPHLTSRHGMRDFRRQLTEKNEPSKQRDKA